MLLYLHREFGALDVDPQLKVIADPPFQLPPIGFKALFVIDGTPEFD
jgi:hypothetical protein